MRRMDQKFTFVLLSGLIIAVLIPHTSSQNSRQLEKQILDRILDPKVYDPRIRPSGSAKSDGSTVVTVNMFVRSFAEIDDMKMEYTTQLTFRQEWHDDRLAFGDVGDNPRYVTLLDPSKIWKPDLFFSNEKEGHIHGILEPNIMIRISPNGTVLYSVRVSAVLSCIMNLRYYPMDSQKCSIIIASYGFAKEQIQLKWRTNAVQMTKNIHIPLFSLDKIVTHNCDAKTVTGEYSCLKINFYLQREFFYYFHQIYVPCILLVILSWFSFWVSSRATTLRMFFGVTLVLAMGTFEYCVKTTKPAISYTTALDVWINTCMGFVVLALLEFFVSVLMCGSRECRDRGYTGMVEEGKPEETSVSREKLLVIIVKKIRNYSFSQRIDVLSRILFPIAFGIFIIAYYVIYGTGRVEEVVLNPGYTVTYTTFPPKINL